MFRPIVRSLWLKQVYHGLFGRTLLERASRIIATSEQERAELIEGGIPGQKILLRRNGIEVPESLPARGAFRRQWHVPEDAKLVLFLGRLMAKKSPELVVETGVANGISTSYLLFALHQNKRGVLHSIEIGDSTYLPPGRKTGWAVPEWLRERWQLHLGDARIMVPELLAQLGTVDVFIHDSLHTYEHLKFEFEQAYPHIRPGGLLISDDALWNSSFPEFAQQVRAPLARILRGVGYLRK